MKELFNTQGKANRLEFWITCFVTTIVCCSFGPMIDNFTSPAHRTTSIVILAVVAVWTLLRVTIRRCHDLEISSWRQFDPRYCLQIPFKKGTIS